MKRLVLLVIVMVLALQPADFSRLGGGDPVLVSGDANILYYNSPAAVRIRPDMLAIGYLTRQGEVRVHFRGKGRSAEDVVVHRFSGEIDTRAGPAADDHAAPAIHYSAQEGLLRLAASYHSTDLFLYESQAPFTHWRLVHRQPGRFTYPRFAALDVGRPLLFFREIIQAETGVFHGNLTIATLAPFTMQTLKSGFAIGVREDVIYAGIPFVAKGDIYFGYTHFYGTGTFKGAHVGIMDMTTGVWRDFPILRDLGDASLMPTGVWSDGVKVRVGVSVSDGFTAKKDEVFIVEIDLATSAETVIHRSGPLDVFYYNNTADFAADGSFLVGRPGFLNPQHVRGGPGHIYVTSNTPTYDIRNFDTSLHLVETGNISNWRKRFLGLFGP